MLHILYIDDEPHLLDLCKIFLEEEGGFTVNTAISAFDGINQLKETAYDGIVSDYQMPGMDGIALLKTLRSQGSTIPFILFTGRGREEVVIQALNSGADFYLQKGGEPQAMFLELAYKIRQAVGKRRAEESLRETNEYLTNLITYASGPIVTWDIDFKITRFNRAFEKLTGFSEAEVLGQDFDILFPDATRADSLDLICRALFGEKWKAVEIPVRTSDGGVRTVIWNSANIYARDGTTPVATIAQGTDITDRKKAEDSLKIAYEDLTATEEELRQQYEQLAGQELELRRNRERLASIFRATPAGIGVVVNRVITEVNDRFCEMTGYSRTELLGRDIGIVFACENGNQDTGTGPFGEGGEFGTGTAEARLQKKDGTVIAVLVSSTLLNPDDCAEGITFTALDITARMMAEEALRTANRKLNLLSSITRHDILNKTTAIDGYLKILRKKDPSPEITEYLDKLESASRAIKSQIGFTRIYQSLGSGKSLWQEVGRMLPRSHIPETIRFESNLRGIEVYADPMLEKVFFNLLDNSLRHGRDVSRVQVSCRESPTGLTILWEDDGVGIAADEKEIIFERGYGNNMGLGLFLAREILAITGIGIRETGTKGKGVRFELDIPKGCYRLFGDCGLRPEQ
jgi:PAS domain S-box-containing protein